MSKVYENKQYHYESPTWSHNVRRKDAVAVHVFNNKTATD